MAFSSFVREMKEQLDWAFMFVMLNFIIISIQVIDIISWFIVRIIIKICDICEL